MWRNVPIANRLRPNILILGVSLRRLRFQTWKWEAINKDFVVGLPKTSKLHDSIWVIIERVTKSAHFIPMKSTYRA